MEKKDLHIVLTSFVQTSFCAKIKDLFIRSGYVVSESISEAGRNQNHDKVLVLCVDHYNLPKEQIIALLANKPNDLPCFCMIHAGGAQLDAEILNHCDEFVLWPCEENELFYRLHGLVAGISHIADTAFPNIKKQSYRILGESVVFKQVLKRVKVFSKCDAPVLIEGETGTGKEMIARAIHYNSERCDHPFIPVNCGALPDNLIENELFGHEKGAYTDAKSASNGLVGQACGGTLFLDEIESLSSKAQVALLRLLQEQEYKPLGSTKPIKADVRIITASNVNLKLLVKQDTIRQDLFYRLNILSVMLPQLKNRDQDIVLLADHFLAKYRLQYQQPDKQLHENALQWIKQYSWPGNVRELENLMHRAFLLAEDNIINEHHFSDSCYDDSAKPVQAMIEELPPLDGSFNDAKSLVVNNFEKQYLSRLMEKFSGNVTLAAKQACKERRAFGKLLKKHGIDRVQYM